MNQRTLLDRLWSPAGFGLVLLLLLFPFLTVSCGTEQPIESTFTGLDLVIGGGPDMTGPGIDEGVENEITALFAADLDADAFAILGVIAVLLGMATQLLPDRLARHGSGAGLALAAGALLTVAVVRAPERVDTAWQRFAETADLADDVVPSTSIQYGYWLVLAVLAVLFLAHSAVVLRTARLGAPRPASSPPSAGDEATERQLL